MPTQNAPSPAEPKKLKCGCPTCRGTGHVDKDRNNPFCASCKGTGKVELLATEVEECVTCGGTGYIGDGHCHRCTMTGHTATEAGANRLANPEGQ